ncbi:Cyn1p [Malassezia vespertilionis]|uniref:Cyn1p n=1 Tax=Malassezia vespertilionis TaxID=2020962 RepID=A0A2N1JBT2_9BASI|nr:Cyn1p [Malassezia vespertilionis]
MTRQEVNELLSPILVELQEKKKEKGLTFEKIAEAIDRSELYTAAIFYGQAKPEEKDLEALSSVLNIPKDKLVAELGPSFFPLRGGLSSSPPTDPTLYRLHEAMTVYSMPIKEIINEKRVEDPAGARVKITFDGKFLPFRRW